MQAYGKDVTMSSRTQTTEVLLRWKYVRQAVGQALYTLEQFTISQAIIPIHHKHGWRRGVVVSGVRQ